MSVPLHPGTERTGLGCPLLLETWLEMEMTWVWERGRNKKKSQKKNKTKHGTSSCPGPPAAGKSRRNSPALYRVREETLRDGRLPRGISARGHLSLACWGTATLLPWLPRGGTSSPGWLQTLFPSLTGCGVAAQCGCCWAPGLTPRLGMRKCPRELFGAPVRS